MQVSVLSHDAISFGDGETCLIVPVYAGEFPLASELLRGEEELALQALADKETLRGEACETTYLPARNAPYQGVLALGLGKREAATPETLRRAAGKACGVLAAQRVTAACFDISHFPELDPAPLLEGLILGGYRFDVYKRQDETKPPPPKLDHLMVAAAKDAAASTLQAHCEIAVRTCLSVNGARHLANTPSNEMTPEGLAEFARGIAEDSGCACEILEEKQMASLGMNAILGVSQGTVRPPRLIILRYEHPEAKRTVAIVGKGITFDSGGISIKPSAGMHEMKYDMCGAAAVLCTMLNVTAMKPAVNVICVAPAAENKTGPAAIAPGDIVKAYNGTSIEVHNTDAEGRLILADAVSFVVDKYKPDAIVDLATLTGACVVALGHYAAGLFDNDAALREELLDAAEASGERLWPMPLDADYEKLIEGNHADLCNIGPPGEAGAVTAAAFIKHFAGNTPWAHIDIAGTAWGGKHIPYLDPKHATGYGVRLLTRWILAQG